MGEVSHVAAVGLALTLLNIVLWFQAWSERRRLDNRIDLLEYNNKMFSYSNEQPQLQTRYRPFGSSN
jgi:hypothetical protein